MSNPHIILKATDDYPKVILDGENISIEGVCMPENAAEMFKPVFDMLDELINSNNNLNIEVNLKYINSMSSKQLLRMFYELNNSKLNIKVLWKHSLQDELMKLKGEEIKSILEIKDFEVIEE